ncbi:MAG: glycerol-3-phosphate acyltransferase, partial [Coriobacteriia bacterium]|nr:glycerol-3-phosphate acyltransferase [Coriobacteriia bacterium]
LGATNARDRFGSRVGRLVAALDMLKGPLAVLLAGSLGAGSWATYGAGIAAIAGHRYPFYLKFRGGRGFATAAGLLASGLIWAVWQGWLPPLDGLLLIGVFTVLWLVYRDRGVPNTVVLPLAYADIALRQPPTSFAACLGVVALAVWLFNLRRVRAEDLFRHPALFQAPGRSPDTPPGPGGV